MAPFVLVLLLRAPAAANGSGRTPLGDRRDAAELSRLVGRQLRDSLSETRDLRLARSDGRLSGRRVAVDVARNDAE